MSNTNQVILNFTKADPNREVEIPKPATEDSAGMDIRFNPKDGKPITIGAGKHYLCETNLKMAIPVGNVGLLFPRSGLSTKKHLGLKNFIGVIDPDFRGELKVALWNTGDEEQTVQPGERIAQLIIMPYVKCATCEVAELTETTRAEGGFGSTGLI